MRLAFKDGVSTREKQRLRWFRLRKRAYQLFRFRPSTAKDVLLVVGCQRSGTSLLQHLLRLDWSSVTYDEISPLSAADMREGLRWIHPDQSIRRLLAARGTLVVAKPLVESQNLGRLLTAIPRGRAIWMYRHYRDVAKSNLHFFGIDNGHRDLAPILAGDEADWRAERLGPDVVERIRRLHERGLSAHDAAALFWYARNSLYFTHGLERDERVRLCAYRDLVARPGSALRDLYGFLLRPYPGDRLASDVIASGSAVVASVTLAPEVEGICGELWNRLEAAPRLLGAAPGPAS